MMKVIKFRLFNSLSMADAPTYTKQTFANSEGWIDKGPITNQFLAP